MESLRERVVEALDHLDHILPAQGPIADFVHHNTLHGYQHLPFEAALAAFESLTGTRGYLPENQFREYHRQGRISEEDLSDALVCKCAEPLTEVLLQFRDRTIHRHDVYRVAMLYELQPITVHQFNWNVQELNALETVQEDVPDSVRRLLLAPQAGNTEAPCRQGPCLESGVIQRLWETVLNKLDLDDGIPHPENMLDLIPEEAETWLNRVLTGTTKEPALSVHQETRQHVMNSLHELLAQVGDSMTLSGFISLLSGVDTFELIRPQLMRICGSVLDAGVAAWHLPDCDRLGLYRAWRASLNFDASPFLYELHDWSSILEQSPDDPLDAIAVHLIALDVPETRWPGYLRRLALELPGWSGMINWRQRHAECPPGAVAPCSLADYLAIRLTLDRLWLSQVCLEIWKIEPGLASLESYFHKNLSEFFVREQLFRGELPEYLAHQAEQLIERAGSERHHRNDWQRLSDRIRTWQSSPMAGQGSKFSVTDQGWRLFRLFQHLGLRREHVETLTQHHMIGLLRELAAFPGAVRLPVWLHAYERNYRENLFQALHCNRRQGRHGRHVPRPKAQVVCCMDEREESFRRHLEELDPAFETWGAAGFFGIAMNYQGVDDTYATPLCPVLIKPDRKVLEVAKPGQGSRLEAHRKGRRFFRRLDDALYHGLRRELLTAHLKIDFLAPFSLCGFLADLLLPGTRRWISARMRRMIEVPVETELVFNADNEAGPDAPRVGFTDLEQAERVEGVLRAMGLTGVFAPIVCMMAHGSTSQNNPHEAAHDCGACGGRQGGPNARVFAAMANRPEVRSLLAERGLPIPHDCWFAAAQHDTCSDSVTWYDLDAIPNALQTAFARVREQIGRAQQLSARERCRRFVSVDALATPLQSYRHVQHRAYDYRQVRPEYGHATNAAAFIGRRSATRGLFLDRRVFLISYDANQDVDGKILENILLTAGPVGAGINLEYYFSTIDNERFGCGTKIPHNITGLFGVMEGVSSDLRTGLPLQMVEIHEAMRLQVIVEASMATVDGIYRRQESLRELIAGAWVHLSVIDPDSGEINRFEPGRGFVPWRPGNAMLPGYDKSEDYYLGHSQAIPPVIIRPPEAGAGL
ncbi:MAG: DUF2309 domain-containing protein [Gammaproteobacteria bacterium]